MGRRALRKIDPALDLAEFLRQPDNLPVPFDAARIFGRSAPLEVEVGSGKGLFLSSAAAAQGETNFLGIEIARKYAVASAARLAKRGLRNAAVVHGDAQPLFRDYFTDSSLAAVHVYFPDPWWKKRHKKRRVMSEEFVAAIEHKLVAGGKLHFWTDVEEYFHAALAVVRERTHLVGPLDVAELDPAHDLDYRTHFERRMRLTGQAVYRAEFCKLSPDTVGSGHDTQSESA